jgi:hypothetical protein
MAVGIRHADLYSQTLALTSPKSSIVLSRTQVTELVSLHGISVVETLQRVSVKGK